MTPITPGWYRARNGQTCKVTVVLHDDFPAKGQSEGLYRSWRLDGTYGPDPQHDLVDRLPGKPGEFER